MERKTTRQWIEIFMEKFPELTKEEVDFIKDVLHWEPEKRADFLISKNLFEDDE